jgi:hypothetical protein
MVLNIMLQIVIGDHVLVQGLIMICKGQPRVVKMECYRLKRN